MGCLHDIPQSYTPGLPYQNNGNHYGQYNNPNNNFGHSHNNNHIHGFGQPSHFGSRGNGMFGGITFGNPNTVHGHSRSIGHHNHKNHGHKNNHGRSHGKGRR